MTKYVAVRVSTFRGDKRIPFNTFVRVAGKYILFCREGDSFEGTRLERLKAKKLQKMFVAEDHLPAYNDYIHENIERAYDTTQQRPIEIRTQIVQGALQAATEDLMEDLTSQAFYSVATEGARRFTKFFSAEPGVLKSLLDIKNTDFSISHHGVVVGALALAIAEELKLTETYPMQMESLVLGGMLHDIEHVYNNIDFSIPPERLSPAERRIYNAHSTAGAARVKKEPFFDSTVVEIIEKHDECIDGSGPLKLKENDLNPMIMAVSTANQFDHLLMYGEQHPKEALKKFLIDKMGVLSLDSMRALQGALKRHSIIS